MKSEHTIRAIIGLGNPGNQYGNHRHNIGFRIVEALAEHQGSSFRKGPDMEYAQFVHNGNTVFLIKPQTFMNSSGKVVPFLLKKGISVDQIMVAHDELELPYGTIKIKKGGSAKGHNGLKSIISACGDGFERLRFGISRPERKEDVSDYVLSNFSEDKARHDDLIMQAVDMIEQMI